MEKELIHKEKLMMFQPKTSFTILSNGRVERINFDEIIHISKSGDATVINTESARYKTHHSMQEILNDLPVNSFYRIHRSHVISLQYMRGMCKNKIMVKELFLPVTKYYKEQMCKKLAILLDRNFLFYYKR